MRLQRISKSKSTSRRGKPSKRKAAASPAKAASRKKKRGVSKSPGKSKARRRSVAKRTSPRLRRRRAGNTGLTIVPQEHGMLAVSFDQAMQVHPLLGEVSKHAQSGLIRHLASHGGDVLAMGLTGATVVMEHGTELVRFTEAGAKLLRAKELRFMTDAAGQKLPTLVNASGRAVENARVMGPLTKGTRIAANLTIAVVTAAHIISGADLAKKLNKLDAKVDFLVAAHRIDQLARIEGVYQQAKELLNLPQTDQTRQDLHRLGRELFEVRSAWSREMVYHVSNLQKTEESRNRVISFFQSYSRKGKDEKVANTVSATEAEIQLINGSLAIHLALAQAAGTLDTFLQVSLPDEMVKLQHVHDLLHERQHFIHEKHPELRDTITEVCDRLDAVTTTYRSMAMPRRDHNLTAAS